jgi:hypothetical protein
LTDQTDNLLVTKKAIMAYLGIASEETFKTFVALKMPAVVINGRWYAHRENLEQWLRAVTSRQIGANQETAE